MHYFSLTGHLDFITVPTQSRSKGPFQGLFYLSNINIFYERDSKHKKNTTSRFVVGLLQAISKATRL